MDTLTIVKAGGAAIDRPEALGRFLSDFVRISGRKMLVHGGGALASEMLDRTGIPALMREGRRITDGETLKICTMVYAGWINKTIVARLQALHCNAVGLSGADGNVVTAVRRRPVPVDFGYAGDVSPAGVEVSTLASFMEQGLTPVLCAITHDGQGGLLNTNADTLATTLAVALAKTATVRLIFCFDRSGVLADPSDEASVIPSLSPADFHALKSAGVIAGGMLPKLDGAFAAVAAGVSEVYIKHAGHLLSTQGTAICRPPDDDHASPSSL
ncbi:MAG: acetylglutamate kinase [Prevotellaceae bacterium]|nr:acetylglutamate kinase [Prevotellaceae bacterium]